MALYNLARVVTNTLGVADVVTGAAVTGYLTFPLAGVPDGATVSYGLQDLDALGNVLASEVGRGTWTAGTLTLARTTVLDSKNGGAKIVLGGNAEVYITAVAEDFDHTLILNIGTNTHTQIDTHIANVANPHSVTAAQAGAPALVNPSVVGNFVSFPNSTGGQADSGVSAASFQPIDATLTSIAALGTAADKIIYTTGIDTWAESAITAFGRSLIDDANAAAALVTLGAGDISGTGVVGQVAEFVTNTKTIQAAKIIGPATNILTLTNAAASTLALNITSAKTLTLTATDNYTLTVPATGTAALLETANVFTAVQRINALSLTIQTDGAKVVFNNTAGNNMCNIISSTVGDLTFNTIGNGIFKVTPSSVSGGLVVTTIGAVTERYVLQVFPTVSTNTVVERMRVNNFPTSGTAGNGIGARITFQAFNNFNNVRNVGYLDYSFSVATQGSEIGRIQFYTSRSNTLTEAVQINGGDVGINITPLTRLHVNNTTTTTNAVLEVQRIEAAVSTASTGSANGFGTGLSWYAETATDTINQQQGLISTSWIDATNASRKAKMSLSAYDTAARLGIEIEASGTAAKLAFYGGTTVVSGAALTTQLTTITFTAPTPDYAIQNLTNTAPYGFVTQDEGNTVLSVIANLQTRVAELEARLGSATGVNLFA